MKMKLAALAVIACVAMCCGNSYGDDLLNQMLDRGGCGGCEQVSTCCDTPAPACGKTRCGLFSGLRARGCGLRGGGCADTCEPTCCERSGLLVDMMARKRCGTGGGCGLLGGGGNCGCDTCGPTCPEPVAEPCCDAAPACGGGCGLLSRLRGRMACGAADSCCDAPAPCAPAPVADPCCDAAPTCGGGCGLFSRLRARKACGCGGAMECDVCAPACPEPVADPCCDAAPACGGGCGLLARLRARCGGGCGAATDCGCETTVVSDCGCGQPACGGCRKGCRLSLFDRLNGNRIARRCRNNGCDDGCGDPCHNSGCGGACGGAVMSTPGAMPTQAYGDSIMTEPAPAQPMQTSPVEVPADGGAAVPEGDGANIYRRNPPIVNPSAFLIRSGN
jgi:hypothetical protein